MDVVVVGAGSLGSLVGGLLARAHDVTLVGREPHVSAVAADGLRVRGAVEATVAPAVRTALRGHDAGVDLADVAADAAVERVADATAANRSSMLQDVDRRRRTEVDSINGYVADSDTPSPVNDVLAGLLRAWESGNGLR